MKTFFTILLLLLLLSCNKYHACVYDYETRKPITDVEVSSVFSELITKTDSIGCFFIEGNKVTDMYLTELVFYKKGYDTSKVKSVYHSVGERTHKSFKGGIIYLRPAKE